MHTLHTVFNRIYTQLIMCIIYIYIYIDMGYHNLKHQVILRINMSAPSGRICGLHQDSLCGFSALYPENK